MLDLRGCHSPLTGQSREPSLCLCRYPEGTSDAWGMGYYEVQPATACRYRGRTGLTISPRCSTTEAQRQQVPTTRPCSHMTRQYPVPHLIRWRLHSDWYLGFWVWNRNTGAEAWRMSWEQPSYAYCVLHMHHSPVTTTSHPPRKGTRCRHAGSTCLCSLTVGLR